MDGPPPCRAAHGKLFTAMVPMQRCMLGDRVRHGVLGRTARLCCDGTGRRCNAYRHGHRRALAPNLCARQTRGKHRHARRAARHSDGRSAGLSFRRSAPLWPGAEDPAAQFRIACHAKPPWRGVAVYASPSNDGFAERALIGERAIMRRLTARSQAAQAADRGAIRGSGALARRIAARGHWCRF